jgi:hypothetical protein
MNRLSLASISASFIAAGIVGCPIYSGEPRDLLVCETSCFTCPGPEWTPSCQPYLCAASYECPGGYVCGVTGTCVLRGAPAGTVDASSEATVTAVDAAVDASSEAAMAVDAAVDGPSESDAADSADGTPAVDTGSEDVRPQGMQEEGDH